MQLMRDLKNALDVIASREEHYLPSPKETPKRASIALILRVRPDPAHPPPSDYDPNSIHSYEELFAQEWVSHGTPELLFIKRAARKGDRWTSHVACPGGRRDPEDESDRAAAERETWEEVGIDLKKENALYVGGLDQRLVTTSWGQVVLMVLCPYVYILPTPSAPTLNLQPTEVASAHWAPLTNLLLPSARTSEHVDVSSRLAGKYGPVAQSFFRLTLGKMQFCAVRLSPTDSSYSTPPPPQGVPLLLWGITLGVVTDLLDLVPSEKRSAELWMFPTFGALDVKLILWLFTWNARRKAQGELNPSAVSEKAGYVSPSCSPLRALFPLSSSLSSTSPILRQALGGAEGWKQMDLGRTRAPAGWDADHIVYRSARDMNWVGRSLKEYYAKVRW
ncbi:hypothetical protein SAICODRAFT_71163, partial [Saitoella complicata NRRL Y-17804]|uniref:uncharacterized protein n=1 Tax=Saitoella complicata (strain BCRC 22490 / CBS 7301 / JCM 7358 / NBRC 10748 / NRRL Y-17804) TaxID=698492 RepID=UPI0008679EF7